MPWPCVIFWFWLIHRYFQGEPQSFLSNKGRQSHRGNWAAYFLYVHEVPANFLFSASNQVSSAPWKWIQQGQHPFCLQTVPLYGIFNSSTHTAEQKIMVEPTASSAEQTLRCCGDPDRTVWGFGALQQGLFELGSVKLSCDLSCGQPSIKAPQKLNIEKKHW